MNVIIIRDKSGKKFSISFTTVVFVMLLLFSLVNYAISRPNIAEAFGLAVSEQTYSQPQDLQVLQQQLDNVYRDQVQQQQLQIAEIREQSSETIKALSHRLATLQAQIMRLEALGKRLTRISKLDSQEFNFDTVPGIGGSGNSAELADFQGFINKMQQLESQLEQHSTQMRILEQVLLADQFYAAIIPSGEPGENGRVSSHFGKRKDPFSGKTSMHKGIDYAGKKGSDVIATADGIVVSTNRQSGYGKTVEIDHGFGISTRYAHNKTLKVKTGDKVKQGQVIATMGSSGRATGPHVHYEVLKNGVQVNPRNYLRTARKE